MGKQSKSRKRALSKAQGALRDIIEVADIYFNNRKFVEITNYAKMGLSRKDL